MKYESEAEAAGMRYVSPDALSPSQQRLLELIDGMERMTDALAEWGRAVSTMFRPAIERMAAFADEFEKEHGRCAECDMLFCEHRKDGGVMP